MTQPAPTVIADIVLAYFAYLLAAAWLVRGVRRRARVRVSVAAALAMAGAWIASTPAVATMGIAAWLPLVWLLAGYWLPAGLWRGPMPRAEAWLRASDAWLSRVTIPRALLPPLEAAYLLVHPIVPLAWLTLRLVHGPRALVDRFWAGTLIAGYVCYGTLPWLQTRPPRALEPPPRAQAPLRRENLWLLDRLSVKANTCPSGHAAVATTVALFVWSAAPAAGALFLALAALIAIATVLCRYHYTADTLLGLIVGGAAWTIASSW